MDSVVSRGGGGSVPARRAAHAWSRALASGAERGRARAAGAGAARAREQAVFASASEALEVEEGLVEVRDLGVEVQVWRMERGRE